MPLTKRTAKAPQAKAAARTPRVPKLRTQGHRARLRGAQRQSGLSRPPDTAETEPRYHQKIAEWLAAGRQRKVAPSQLTVGEPIERYMVHALDYYRDAGGQPTGHLDTVRNPLRHLDAFYGTSRAANFGPLALKSVRDRMIELGWLAPSPA